MFDEIKKRWRNGNDLVEEKGATLGAYREGKQRGERFK